MSQRTPSTTLPFTLPLIARRDLAAPLARHAGQVVSAAQFLGEALALAETLPEGGQPINLCHDRYLFALGLAAALLRGQTSLMPPNVLPETLRQLQVGSPAGSRTGPLTAYALVEGDGLDVGGLRRVPVIRPAQARPATEVPQIDAALEAVCLLTSGTTGPPQRHAKRWGPLVANIAAEAERLAELMDRPSLAGVTLLATVPPQHSYGFESSVLLALLGGACFDAGRPFYPADIAEALARLPAPRALVTTPFHLKTLLLAGLDLPPVDLVLSATAPLSPQLAAQAEAQLHGRLAEIYGCTEAGQVAARRPTAGDTWTALGELRLWCETVDGAERFMVAGGHVVDATALGDVLVLEDARRFRLLGRANDIIQVAGKRSSLAHLNFHLNRIEGIEDGAFWMPEDQADDVTRPVALVVAPTLSARQIVLALRPHVDSVFLPRQVLHVAALPREATGKLTAQTLARIARQALADAAAGRARFTIARDHPAFAGHFPGQPVLPGVVLLTLVLQAAQRHAVSRSALGATPCIDQVKFLAPVGPGAALVVQLRAHGATGTAVAFEVTQGDETVARGQLSRGAGAGAGAT